MFYNMKLIVQVQCDKPKETNIHCKTRKNTAEAEKKINSNIIHQGEDKSTLEVCR